MSIKATIKMRDTIYGTMSIPKSTTHERDYEKLINLPQIESVTLIGNKTFDELGMSECTNQEIINLFK